MSDEAQELAWHAVAVETLPDLLETDVDLGLKAEQVNVRRARFGANELTEPDPPNAVLRFLAQFTNPLVGALLVAAVVAAIVALTEEAGSWADTIAILLIVTMNAVLGHFQERKAEAALAALKRMSAVRAKVIRNGEVSDVDAAALVPGDVINLEAGDAVPADARLVRSSDFDVVEAALTGESMPVHKESEALLPDSTVVADRRNMVFTGTTVSRGSARAVVAHTGARTELGRIGTMIQRAKREPTPLERRLVKLGRIILVACVLISVFVFAVGLLRGSQAISMLLLTAVSLAVAAIPEGLPAITTITLALGVQRMAKKGAIVRKLPAVETLGSATVICTDKTGTLTQNAMTVRRMATLEGELEVSGEGFEAHGRLSRPSGEVVVDLSESARRLLTVAVLCNEAALEEGGEGTRVVGDPTDGALMVLGPKAGLTSAKALGSSKIERRLPFDSDRKRASVIVRRADGSRVAYVKGSPDVILELSTHAWGPSGVVELDDRLRARLTQQYEAYAAQSYRVLAMAEREDPLEDPETGLVFVGYAAMVDPPRPEAKEAIAQCHDAGILVTMITGDHKLTASAIAKELGIWGVDALALTGAELATMADEALDAVVERVRVFARVTAEQKLRIVRSLTRAGHVVAMTGDGVNDAPALKEAAIGVAMGKSGTDVARQSSEMILSDDNFATIVHAIREGRAIFRNIRKFIFFLGSSNAGLVLAVIALAFLDRFPPLTPLQLLWINLVTNGLPAMALGVDPAERGLMRERPRPPSEGIVDWRDGFGVLFVGVVMAAAALCTYFLPEYWPAIFASSSNEGRLLEARTMAFAVLALAPLAHAFNCRSPIESIASLGLFTNSFLWVAIGLSGALQVLAVAVPALGHIFHTIAPTAAQWGVILALSLLPLPAVELGKLIDRRRSMAPAK